MVDTGAARILVDCGLFQGPRLLRQRNWQRLPVDPTSLDAIVLTHAHLDHSGYLPVLRKHGFDGPVYCSSGTQALSRVLLPDSGYLQEEDARYAARKKFSRHQHPQALYTQADAEECLNLFKPSAFGEPVAVAKNTTATFFPAGHILGAAWIRLEVAGISLTFSGDLGRLNDPVMNPPKALQATDYLVVESTYGNRRHAARSPLDELRDIVNQTMRRDGILIIPSFAVGRAQTVLHLLATLHEAGQIPTVPVYLNSPMAINATDIFCTYADEHRLSTEQCRKMCNIAGYVNSAEESRALNRRCGPMIVLSASGMATGGRILHHFKAWLGDDRNTVLFTGFQAPGTRGEAMVNGAKSVTIHGQPYAVRAEIVEMTSLSAHADCDELLDWIAPAVTDPPSTIFITHGEPVASNGLRERLGVMLGLSAEIPTNLERRELG